MSSTLRAQLRDLGRWFWIHLLNRVAFALFFAICFYCFPRLLGLEISETRSHVLISFFLLSVIPGFAFTDTIRSWYICMGFTRPISTLQLVIVPLLLSVIVGLVSFLIPASLFLWLLGTWFPLAGPSALVVCGVCCLFASLSTPATVAGRYTATTLTLAVMSIFFVFALATLHRGSQDSQWIASGEAAYWDFPWFIYVGLAVLSAMAITITVLGVQRRRYGESIWSVLKIPAVRLSAYGRETRRGNRVAAARLLSEPFRNQWTAQCWYDFRKNRKLLLFPVFLLPMAAIAFVIVGNHVDLSPQETFDCLAGSLVLGPILCQLFATGAVQFDGTASTQGLRNQNMACPLPVFDATRPMRSDQLIAVKLLLVVGWSLVSWLIMVVAALLYLRFIGDWEAVMKVGESFAPRLGEASVYWWMAGGVSGLLLLIGTASTFLAFVYWAHITLRLRVFLGLSALATITLLLVAGDIISDWSFRSVWITYSYLFAAGVAVLCVFAFNKALSSGLLSKPYLGMTLSMWAVFVCTTVALAIKLWPAIPASTPLIVYVIAAAMLLIPLAAITAAPLGLAEHRHG